MKQNIIRLYKKLLDDATGKLSYTVDRLKTHFHIPSSTFSDWTKNINQQMEEQLLEKILDLYLQCKTQQEIETITSIPQRTVSAKIDKIMEILKDLAENTGSEYMLKFPNIAKKAQSLAVFQPQLYTIWNFARNNNETVQDAPEHIILSF